MRSHPFDGREFFLLGGTLGEGVLAGVEFDGIGAVARGVDPGADLSSRTPVTWWIGSSLVWLVLGSIVGLVVSMKFHMPDWLVSDPALLDRARPASEDSRTQPELRERLRRKVRATFRKNHQGSTRDRGLTRAYATGDDSAATDLIWRVVITAASG